MIDRRRFVKTSMVATAGIAGLGALPNTLQGRSIYISPSDRIRVALIGGRSMGWSNIQAFLKFPQVECVSLCDIDDEILNRRASDIEKISGKKPQLLTKDWRRIIDSKETDAVIVATPDHWHCLQSISAMESGKDVYCEKPLANSIAECDADGNGGPKAQQDCPDRAMAAQRPTLAGSCKLRSLR
ncbi:MAG: Gfo/Idh/MocA family oxidoreductase [Marinilabiliales bacterium]|nr:Gfo/Idh/MocA family oxidoreductase [Marinilabiliales bacterium]